jgi:hypothetical protein
MARRRRKGRSFLKTLKQVHKAAKLSVRHHLEAYLGMDMGIMSGAEKKRVQSLINFSNATATPTRFGADKQYGGLTVNLGKKIVAMGSNVPGELQGYAMMAASGSGDMSEQQLLAKLRSGMGISKSGETWLNGVTGSIQRSVQTAARAGTLWNTAQQGGLAGASAQAGLLQMGVDKVNDIASSKTMEKVLVTASEKLFSNPIAGQQLFYAIGRGLRLGGGIVTAALMAWQVGESYFTNRGRQATAEGAVYDQARQAGLNYSPEARAQRDAIAKTVEAASPFDRMLDKLGFGGGLAEAKAKEESKAIQAFQTARANAGKLGIDTSGLLAAYAAARGLKVQQLNERQRNEAINAAVAAKMKQNHDSAAADAYARSQVAIRGQDSFGHWLITSRATLDAEKELYRNEFAQRSTADRAVAQVQEQITQFLNWRIEQLRNDPRFEEKIKEKMRAGDYEVRNARQRHAVLWTD